MRKPPHHNNEHPKVQIKPTSTKVRAQKRGLWAERLTALYLRLSGYRVLAHNFKTKVGEVDLVVRRKNMLCFVEVKARNSLSQAAEAVTARQRQRIQRTAELFLAQNPHLSTCDIRFDVALVTGPLRLTIVRDAWQA